MEPGETEVHRTFHDDLFPDTGNVPPPFSFSYHLVFEDVRIERYQLLAPFFAALSWRLADRVAGLEPRWFTRRFGFLLFATAR